jgi:hypothetical protein
VFIVVGSRRNGDADSEIYACLSAPRCRALEDRCADARAQPGGSSDGR